jgi:hypothetical protein
MKHIIDGYTVFDVLVNLDFEKSYTIELKIDKNMLWCLNCGRFGVGKEPALCKCGDTLKVKSFFLFHKPKNQSIDFFENTFRVYELSTHRDIEFNVDEIRYLKIVDTGEFKEEEQEYFVI